MVSPLHVPRVNNNDDSVLIVEISVKPGDFVKRDQVVGAVETDKATVEVQAERDGYVLDVVGRCGEMADVGSVLLWLGETADEPVPARSLDAGVAVAERSASRPTAKARALMREQGLDPMRITASGGRLTASDVKAWIANPPPNVPGEYQELSGELRGMLSTVLWHRDHVAHGYLEIEYEPGPWEQHAADYARQHKLMFSPLLPLMAFRLVELAKATPRINAAIVNDRRYQYHQVNLGFTLQAGQTLYLTVIHGADGMDAARFIDAMGEVQRHAIAHKLRPDETSGATLAFSSMARWNVSRHIPLLAPHTGLMIAHAAPRGSGKAVLGASYDHRLMSGFDVAQVLQALAQPPA